jgi:hypothetical protein
MERVINLLEEKMDKLKESFIDNSITVYLSKNDSPIPDTNYDLEMIIELNKAISVLQNSLFAKKQDNDNFELARKIAESQYNRGY